MIRKIWNIRSKILSGYILIVVCLGLLLLAVSYRLDDLQKETDYVSDHDIAVQNQTHTIEKLVLDMETAQRGFILTGNEAYLEPYNNAMDTWKTTMDNVKSLVSKEPAQLNSLAKIEQEISNWIETAGNTSIAYKRQNNDDALQTFFNNDPGKPIIDQIRQDFDDFRAVEQSATSSRAAALAEGNRKLVNFILLLWILLTGIAVITALTVSNNIVNAIKQVTGAIRDIGTGGNLTRRVAVKSRDEFFTLAAVTNELLSSVESDNWRKEQLKNTALSLQNLTSAEELGNILLDKLAKMMELPVAALYLSSKDRSEFTLIASYNTDKEALPGTFREGEGLVGQCAASKSRVLVRSIPSDRLTLKSGFGSVTPLHLAAVPVLFENEVVSVLEFGTMEELSDSRLKFLDELLNVAGSSIHSITIKMELDQLYRESLAVNEELQVQTEELQSQAEELQSQTEELMMQAEEMYNLNERLESQKAIAEHSAQELEKFARELEKSSNFKSEFLANMSHELRTPLNSMLILSQLLAENQNGSLTNEEENYAAVIHSSGQDLLHLINDILDLSKVEAGQMDLELMDVSVREVLDVLYLQFEKTAQLKNLTFTLHWNEGVPDMIRTDSMRIQQILKNLLSNAFKFTEKGEVLLSVEQVNGLLVPQLGTPVDLLAFTVRDTGTGISKDKQEIIFEAFRQAEGSTSRRYGGTGLGLSISLQLARLLGGFITLDSEPGAGSAFTFYLPLPPAGEKEGKDLAAENNRFSERPEPIFITQTSIAQTEAAAAAESNSETFAADSEAAVQAGLFEQKTVLIVDDDIRNVYALTSFLEKLRMKVLIAQNGYESLDAVSQEHVDIVLMDIMMPEMDGYQAIREIRSTLGFTELPIIALTAKAMKEDRDKCLAAGASDYISKPLDIQQVLRIMQFWMEKANSSILADSSILDNSSILMNTKENH
ncbi:CHASE3 domain-containing protein [Paenibacillus pinistramenti]|uniref:CHASE3 domain-containing protein n=1 Tax=Paenibacillus pinistramenti TaxID=1768003 RepID=UPI001109FC77|nr:CHASE3 domain-containing protein [Paenibacillus pinistramenti]